MISFSNDLACRDLVELVTDYLDDELPPLQRVRMEAHLDECDGCREYLLQMRQTVGILGRLRAESIEPVMRDRLLQVFRDWKRGR